MNPWDYPELFTQQEPESSTLNSIMHVLGYLDYPRNSIATGVKNVLDDDLASGFFGGLSEGWGGPKVSNLTAVTGMREADENDDWPTWLGLTGAHFASDLLDPLFAVGKVGKAARQIPTVARGLQTAKESYHASPVGRWLAHGFANPELEEGMNLAQASAGSIGREATDLFNKYHPALLKDLKEKYGDDLIELSNDWEFGRLDKFSPETIDGLMQMEKASLGASKGTRAEMEAIKYSGTKPGIIQDMFIKHPLNRIMTKQGLDELAEPIKGKGMSGQTGQILDSSRDLFTPIERMDPNNPLRKVMMEKNEAGELVPIVTKKGDFWKVTEDEGFDTFRNVKVNRPGYNDAPGQLVESSLKEVYQSGRKKPGTFIEDPMTAYLKNTLTEMNRQPVLTFLNKYTAKQIDNMTAADKKAMFEAYNLGKSSTPFVEVKDFTDLSLLPKNYERLKIPGLEHLAGPKAAIADLHKVGKKLYDPDTPLGWLEELGNNMQNSAIGGLFRDATQWWKNNTLAHPATAFGNIISNIPQMYMGGINPFAMVSRAYQGASVYLGKGTPVFEGMSNKALANALEDTGLFASSWGRAEARSIIDMALEPKGKVRRYADDKGKILGTVADAVGRVGEKWGDYNQWMLKTFQGAPESVNRLAVAIDWLKRNAAGKAPTQEEIVRAAAHAKKAMVDYSALTPAEKLFSQVVPFYAWQRGILGRTAEVMLEDPQKLANYSRMLNYTFDPMDEQDKAIADPWMREAAPTKGMMGATWDDILMKVGDWTGLREYFPTAFDPSPMGKRQYMLGRYIPQGNLEQMYERPLDFIQSSVNPLLKVPLEVMSNYSTFKDRPIDPIAQKFPYNLTNPLTGSDLYTQGQTQPFGVSMPATYEYLLGQIPGGRTLGAVSELGRGAGLWSDQYKPETSPPEALTSWLSGFKLYPFDAAKAEQRRKREIQIQERDVKSQIKYAARMGDYDTVDRLQNGALAEIAKRKNREIGRAAED